MRKFAFRLDAVLGIRRHLEDQARLAYGAAASRCGELETAIADRTQREHDALATLPHDRTGDTAYRIASEAYAARMAHERARFRQELNVAEEERERRAEAYREARRRADVLQRLRDRRFERWTRDYRRHEQGRLDEVAITLHRRAEEER